MNIEKLTELLRTKGLRVTPVKRALLEVLSSHTEPITVNDLVSELKKKGESPNLTTIYRQLDGLVDAEIVDRVMLDPKEQYFELSRDHHHHFVCQDCNDVVDVHSEEVETAFHRFESQLKDKGLIINKHELTFFGSCASCS